MQISDTNQLPGYYLKGFADSNGRFTVFDYNQGFIKDRKCNPSDYVEKNWNILEYKNSGNDTEETGYPEENKFQKLFSIIQSSKGVPVLQRDQIFILQEFVNTVFVMTRKPSINNRKYFKDFSLIVTSENSLTSITIDTVIDMENFRITYIPNDLILCCDNPLILRNDNLKDFSYAEYIFPLTKNHLLIKTNKCIKKSLNPSMNFMACVAILLQGEKYWVSANDFLDTIRVISKEFDLQRLKYNLFSILDQAMYA